MDVLNALNEPMPAREIARTLQLSQAHADRIAYNLTAAGYVEIVSSEQREGRRPVYVYARANWTRQW